MGKFNNLALSSYTDLFKSDNAAEDVTLLQIKDLKSYTNQPFKVVNDESMDKLVESIKENGVLSPIIVRHHQDGGYEILSGHRRTNACKIAGIEKVPAIIKDIDDDTAAILLVDSNLQRESILPSEKAFAYKMRIEASKRKVGRKTKSSFAQVGQNSRKELAEQTGESSVQIQRYLRLTYLIKPFLDMVDEKKLSMNAAVELSYPDEGAQKEIHRVLTEIKKTPSIAQAQHLRKLGEFKDEYSGISTNDFEDIIKDIMFPKTNTSKITLKASMLRKYFPKDYTAEQMEDTLIQLLEEWSKTQNDKTV